MQYKEKKRNKKKVSMQTTGPARTHEVLQPMSDRFRDWMI